MACQLIECFLTPQIWLLEKLLFIRAEDIELGLGRVRGDVK